MSTEPRHSDRPGRKSRLFQARPDRLLVDEWVPSIALPAPPPTPLEEAVGEPIVDEHGLPELAEEPEESVRVGPARLYVGQGQRPKPASAGEEISPERDYFVAELSLPRPEDGLPFGFGAQGDEPDPWSEELALEGAELSDPDIPAPDLAGALTLDLDPMEPPTLFLPPPPGHEPPQAVEPQQAAPPPQEPEPASLGPSLAREPLARRVQAPSPASPRRTEATPAPAAPTEPVVSRPPPAAVIRSKPSWTRARPLPAPPPAKAPQFQAREEPLPNPWVQRLVSWPTLVVLVAVLVAATALLVRGLAT
ncbi:MAG: hypothetical protein ABIO70_04240 [Pseudomonadota bacterium]